MQLLCIITQPLGVSLPLSSAVTSLSSSWGWGFPSVRRSPSRMPPPVGMSRELCAEPRMLSLARQCPCWWGCGCSSCPAPLVLTWKTSTSPFFKSFFFKVSGVSSSMFLVDFNLLEQGGQQPPGAQGWRASLLGPARYPAVRRDSKCLFSPGVYLRRGRGQRPPALQWLFLCRPRCTVHLWVSGSWCVGTEHG